jgi:hypothetical protein
LTAAIIIGLAAVCFAPPGHAATAGGAYYARIIIPQAAHRPPQTTVYVQFHGAQMRLATSVAALAKAKPVAATSSRRGSTTFPVVDLPVPARALPPGCTKVRAYFMLYAPAGSVAATEQPASMYARVGPCYRDTQGAVWSYWSSASAAVARVPGRTRAVRAPDFAKPKVAVAAKAQREQLSIVVQLMAGKVALAEIQKDGKLVEDVYVTVRNGDGRIVASKRGPLTAFGFT